MKQLNVGYLLIVHSDLAE